MRQCMFFLVMVLMVLIAITCSNKNPVGSNNNSVVFTDSVTDVEGNMYHAVTIGTQTWTVENLRTTKYNDGTAIPFGRPGYCWYGNDSINKKIYGALYSWDVVNTGKLAPAGWHVPTSFECSILSAYLGGDSLAGGKMKEAGTTHWLQPNTGATNASGFTGLPGGGSNNFGQFLNFGEIGNWWTSTQFYSSSEAYIYYLINSDALLHIYTNYQTCGISVRLLHD